MGDNSVVLTEVIDEAYEPTDEDILEYAEWLGMELPAEESLLWIAREGLKAPLPPNWKPCSRTEDGEIYYFNFQTGESVWDHPCDEYYKALYAEERAKLLGRKGQGGHVMEDNSKGAGSTQPAVPVAEAANKTSSEKVNKAGAGTVAGVEAATEGSGTVGLVRQASMPPPKEGRPGSGLLRQGSLQPSSVMQRIRKVSPAPSETTPMLEQQGLEVAESKGDVKVGATRKEAENNDKKPEVENSLPPRDTTSSKSSAVKGGAGKTKGTSLQQQQQQQQQQQHQQQQRQQQQQQQVPQQQQQSRKDLPPASAAAAAAARTGGDGPKQKVQSTWSMSSEGDDVAGIPNGVPKVGSGSYGGSGGDLAGPKTARNTQEGAVQKPQKQGSGGSDGSIQSSSGMNANQEGRRGGNAHGAHLGNAKGGEGTRKNELSGGKGSVNNRAGANPKGGQGVAGHDSSQRQGQSSDSGQAAVLARAGGANQQQKRGSPFGSPQGLVAQRHSKESSSTDEPDSEMTSRTSSAEIWEEVSRIKDISAAAQRRVAKFEAECDARFAKLKGDREALIKKRETDIMKLAERLNTPFDQGALSQARNVAVEEGRALVGKEREAAVAAARDEVELLKQRMKGKLQEELGTQLALERQKLNIDPGAVGKDGMKGPLAEFKQAFAEWTTAMEKENPQALSRWNAMVGSFEQQLLERTVQDIALRVECLVEQEEKAALEQLRDRGRQGAGGREKAGPDEQRNKALGRGDGEGSAEPAALRSSSTAARRVEAELAELREDAWEGVVERTQAMWSGRTQSGTGGVGGQWDAERELFMGLVRQALEEEAAALGEGRIEEAVAALKREEEALLRQLGEERGRGGAGEKDGSTMLEKGAGQESETPQAEAAKQQLEERVEAEKAQMVQEALEELVRRVDERLKEANLAKGPREEALRIVQLEAEKIQAASGGPKGASEDGKDEAEGALRTEVLLDMKQEIERERARRWEEMEEQLQEELERRKMDRLAVLEASIEKDLQAEAGKMRKKKEEEVERKILQEKLAELEGQINIVLEQEREMRLKNARKVMEASLRKQIIAERESSLGSLRKDWEGMTEEKKEEWVEAAKEEQKREMEEQLKREVRAEVEEYKARLMQQVESSRDTAAMVRQRKERDMTRIEQELRVRREELEDRARRALESYRADIKLRLETERMKLKREAERALERAKAELEGKLEKKMTELRMEMRIRLEATRREMEVALRKELEEQRVQRLESLSRRLKNEERELRRDWKALMAREEAEVRRRHNARMRQLEAKMDADWLQMDGSLLSPSGPGAEGGSGSGAGALEAEALPGSKSSDYDEGRQGAAGAMLGVNSGARSEFSDILSLGNGRGWAQSGEESDVSLSHGFSVGREGADGAFGVGLGDLGSFNLTDGEDRPGLPTAGLRLGGADGSGGLGFVEDLGKGRKGRMDSGDLPKAGIARNATGGAGAGGRESTGHDNALEAVVGSHARGKRGPWEDDAVRTARKGEKPTLRGDTAEEPPAVSRRGSGAGGSLKGAKGTPMASPAPNQNSPAMMLPLAHLDSGDDSGSNFGDSTREFPHILGQVAGDTAGAPGGVGPAEGEDGNWLLKGWPGANSAARPGRRSRSRNKHKSQHNDMLDYYSTLSESDSELQVGERQLLLRTQRRGSDSPTAAGGSAGFDDADLSFGEKASMVEKAKLFAAEQQAYLKERQAVIEAAWQDWKKRKQAVEQLSDEDEKRRKAQHLMDLKATLDQHVRELNDDARHVRQLQRNLLNFGGMGSGVDLAGGPGMGMGMASGGPGGAVRLDPHGNSAAMKFPPDAIMSRASSFASASVQTDSLNSLEVEEMLASGRLGPNPWTRTSSTVDREGAPRQGDGGAGVPVGVAAGPLDSARGAAPRLPWQGAVGGPPLVEVDSSEGRLSGLEFDSPGARGPALGRAGGAAEGAPWGDPREGWNMAGQRMLKAGGSGRPSESQGSRGEASSSGAAGLQQQPSASGLWQYMQGLEEGQDSLAEQHSSWMLKFQEDLRGAGGGGPPGREGQMTGDNRKGDKSVHQKMRRHGPS